jgi:CMP-N-acetylneuraminic acid synthetase
MKIIALLPMKAHSERIPNKNMRDFCGRPLYHVIMESLLRSKYISKVLINTDSNEIKQDALLFFKDIVIIHDRPESIRGDFVSMNKIIGYDIEKLAGEYFLQTHSTNPLLKTKTIDKAIKKYFQILSKGYDSLFSVTRLQTRLYDSNGRAINHNPDELIRTQDLPPVYEENSCLYIFNRKSFGKKKRRIGENPFMFEIPREEALDIDEETDFEIAEIFYKKL